MTRKKPENLNDSNKKRNSPRGVTLTRLEHISRELASLYRSARNGKLPVADAGRLAYILQILSKALESSDLESRVKALEGAKENSDGNK